MTNKDLTSPVRPFTFLITIGKFDQGSPSWLLDYMQELAYGDEDVEEIGLFFRQRQIKDIAHVFD